MIMSPYSELEKGPRGESSRELRGGEIPNGQNSVSASNSVVEIIKRIPRILFWSIMVIVFSILLGILQLMNYATRKKVYLVLCVIAIIFDPLFFYIPVMNDEKKCIELDKKVGITATVLRSFFDFLKTVHIFSELRTDLHENGSKRSPSESPEGLKRLRSKLREKGWKRSLTELRKNERIRLWLLSLIDILVILPIPQVLVIFRIKGTKFLFAMTFFLTQYLVRVIRTYFLCAQATGVSGMLAEATRAIVAFNLLLYMHGGFVFGSLWYFYAIRKTTACWKQACVNQTGCSHSSFHCHDSLRDYDVLNDFCPIKTGNETSYNFGLFKDALQSGIVEETYFLKKLLHCLQWGLQNLSAFGQNLETSTDIWENIFAICMINYGVVFFVFLIAKMQSDTARSQRIKLKLEEISQWPQCDNLSKDVRMRIRQYKRHKWQETKRLDVVNVVNDLPEDIGRNIKYEIGLKLLKKVKEFEAWDAKLLGDVCGRLKPVSFSERTHILRKDEPIYEMIFVIKGRLWTYPTHPGRKAYLEDCDFCGEELISWAKDELSSDLPISSINIQAVTKVEAFSLLASDLKRFISSVKRTEYRAARVIQACWRLNKLRNKRPFGQKLRSQLKAAMDKLSTS